MERARYRFPHLSSAAAWIGRMQSGMTNKHVKHVIDHMARQRQKGRTAVKAPSRVCGGGCETGRVPDVRRVDGAGADLGNARIAKAPPFPGGEYADAEGHEA
jgi:hypothetical protein